MDPGLLGRKAGGKNARGTNRPSPEDVSVKGRAFAAEVAPRAKPGAPVDPVVADVADVAADSVGIADLVDSAEDGLVVADVADAVEGKIRGSFPGLISGRRRS
jgi:hypothetical protein